MYDLGLVSGKLWLRLSKAFEKFIFIAPIFESLFNWNFQNSIIAIFKTLNGEWMEMEGRGMPRGTQSFISKFIQKQLQVNESFLPGATEKALLECFSTIFDPTLALDFGIK